MVQSEPFRAMPSLLGPSNAAATHFVQAHVHAERMAAAAIARQNTLEQLQQMAAEVQPAHAPEEPAMLPVATTEGLPSQADSVAEVAGYTHTSAVLGYGQVNGFEMILRSGCRLQFGDCSGRRESMLLGEGECLTRIAGRTDFGRRQRGARSAQRGCLVSLQFTTSKSREVIFGRGHRTRMDGSFSLLAPYRYEIIGCRTLAPDIPIVVSLQTQPRRDVHTSSTSSLPLVSPSTVSHARAAGAGHAAVTRGGGAAGHNGAGGGTASAHGAGQLRLILQSVVSMGRRVRRLEALEASSERSGGMWPFGVREAWSPTPDSARSERSGEAGGGDHGRGAGDGRGAGNAGERAGDGAAGAAGERAAAEEESLGGCVDDHDEGEASMAKVLGLLAAEQRRTRKTLEALVEAQTCKVCMEGAIGGVLVPCGHLALCVDCAMRMRVGSACPFCRTPATSFSLTYTV